MAEIELRELRFGDRQEWLELFQGYAQFYQVEISPEGVDTTWGWLMDETHPVSGVVAVDGGTLIGIAHFRSMPNPLRGMEVGFLDDLFVRHESRGKGVADCLIQHVKDQASARGWKIVRWLTRDNNYRARGVYDRVADRSDWITYELHVA